MSDISVQKVNEKNPSGFSLQQETVDLLNRVKARAYELFQRRGGSPGNDVADWLQAEGEIFEVPRMELTENEREFQLQLALPGFESNHIHVAALPNSVIVEAEAAQQREERTGDARRREFGERRVFRQIPLPEPVDVDRVVATLDKGLLQVRAEKVNGRKAA